MKKKIKTWLIHLLGGVTVAEKRKINQKSFLLGMKGACIDIQERLTHEIDEEIPTGK